MANYRCERIFVMLERGISGLDHLNAVDPVELAWHQSDSDAEALGLTPIGEFCVAAFDGPPPYREKPKWHSASTGLRTVRGLMAAYEKRMASGNDPRGRSVTQLEKTLVVL